MLAERQCRRGQGQYWPLAPSRRHEAVSAGREEFTITEYQRYWNESERQAYRRQVEFRELWPETPNELGRQIVKHLDSREKSAAEVMNVPVVAA